MGASWEVIVRGGSRCISKAYITKTCLFKYIENFTTIKIENF